MTSLGHLQGATQLTAHWIWGPSETGVTGVTRGNKIMEQDFYTQHWMAAITITGCWIIRGPKKVFIMRSAALKLGSPRWLRLFSQPPWGCALAPATHGCSLRKYGDTPKTYRFWDFWEHGETNICTDECEVVGSQHLMLEVWMQHGEIPQAFGQVVSHFGPHQSHHFNKPDTEYLMEMEVLGQDQN